MTALAGARAACRRTASLGRLPAAGPRARCAAPRSRSRPSWRSAPARLTLLGSPRARTSSGRPRAGRSRSPDLDQPVVARDRQRPGDHAGEPVPERGVGGLVRRRAMNMPRLSTSGDSFTRPTRRTTPSLRPPSRYSLTSASSSSPEHSAKPPSPSCRRCWRRRPGRRGQGHREPEGLDQLHGLAHRHVRRSPPCTPTRRRPGVIRSDPGIRSGDQRARRPISAISRPRACDSGGFSGSSHRTKNDCCLGVPGERPAAEQVAQELGQRVRQPRRAGRRCSARRRATATRAPASARSSSSAGAR